MTWIKMVILPLASFILQPKMHYITIYFNSLVKRSARYHIQPSQQSKLKNTNDLLLLSKQLYFKIHFLNNIII